MCLNALLWNPCLSGVGLHQHPSAWIKEDYAIISTPLNAPQHLRMFLSSWTQKIPGSAWISQAVLLCHPSLQGISQQFYKKNISVPSILTIILICLNWHSPADSLFKSYTHCYVFIP